jgi:gluconolactonase
MAPRILLAVAFGIVGTALLAQPQTPTTPSNLQAAQDPRYPDVIAKCKTPPPGRTGGPAGGARAGGAAAAGGAGRAGAAPTPASADYAIAEIPGVIAAGQRWTTVYQTTGNNADGPIASEDGGLLIAQNDNGAVVRIDSKGQATTLYRDTNTGGSLSRSSTGALFVASRGIGNAVLQLAPQRRVLANSYNGDALECLGGNVNDLTADSRGGVYFTQGGLFYADPKGVVTQYGTGLQTNGVILSPDEKTIYVTNRQTIVAFDVQPDGSLTKQRDFARLPVGSGDGMTVDSAGRVYVTAGGGGGDAMPGLYVFSADGKLLGHIPSPRNLITVAFSGTDKKTLYAIANDRVRVDIYAVPMIAQGFRGRAK